MGVEGGKEDIQSQLWASAAVSTQREFCMAAYKMTLYFVHGSRRHLLTGSSCRSNIHGQI